MNEEGIMSETTELSTKQMFLSAFEKQDYYFDSGFSKKAREAANRNLESLEFPTSKTEYWKYSRTNRIVKGEYKVQPINDYTPSYNLPEGKRIILVNGFVDEKLSNFSESEILVVSLSQAKEKHSKLIEKWFNKNPFEDKVFASINTAYHQDGAFIFIPKNISEEETIHIISINSGNGVISQPKNLIVAGQGSKANVLLREISENAVSNFNNVVTEIFVGENAFLELNKIQEMENGNFQVATDQVSLEANSNFKINTFTKKGDWVRNNLNIQLNGENIETWLNGLYLLKGNQHVDNHTLVDHFVPNCVSHELYKGILNDKSTGVFNGKVFVHKDAQKTNAYQSNNTVVLTDDAKSYSKPELEIYADDVKCSHGSTTGQLDEEALFYLKSRGISEAKANGMMLHAFAGDVISHIGVPEVAEEIEKFVFEEYGS